MNTCELSELFREVIKPKYEKYKLDIGPVFFGVDCGGPGCCGICYDKSEQMWIQYSYNDWGRSIYKWFNTQEEACSKFYDYLMDPIISHENWLEIREPDEEEKEALKRDPIKGIVDEKNFGAINIEGRTVISFLSTAEEVTDFEIPDNLKNGPVTKISNLRKNVVGVKLPKYLKILGDRVFFKTYLRSISMNSELQEMGEYCFAMCWNLKNIDLPQTLETMGESAFAGSGLEEVKIPPKITELNRTFFRTKLVNITIPGNVKKIDNQAFDEIETLEEVNMEEGVEYIGYSAFCICPKLHSIYIPESVTHIDEVNFLECAEDFVLVTPKGSYAEEYAKEHDIAFRNEKK